MEKRNFRQADLGLDIHHLDGYRVVYEDTNRAGGKTLVRLLDEQGNVTMMVKADIDKSNIYAYAEMIKLYIENKENEKLSLIKNLFSKGMSRNAIAKELNMAISTVGDYFRYYDLNHNKGYGEENRLQTDENLGFDLDSIDGYRVSYEKLNQENLKYIARLIDEKNNVIAINKSTIDSKINAFAGLIQSYTDPLENTLIKLDAIKKLFNSGMSKSDISKKKKIKNQTLNSYFYLYNLDNRNNF